MTSPNIRNRFTSTRRWDIKGFSISRIIFPLFLFSLGFGCGTKHSLAGDEIDESKNNQLPSLRQILVKRPLGKGEVGKSGNSQMPSMWKPKCLERWFTAYASRRGPALHVQRLRLSVFKALSSFRHFPSSFFSNQICRVLEETL